MSTSVFISVSYTDLNNTENLFLHKQIRAAFGVANVPELGTYLPIYSAAIDAEDEAMVRVEANSKTKRLKEKDEERDTVFRYGGAYLDVHTHHWDPTVVEAAEDLMVIYRTFRKIPTYNYKKESEEIVNYLQAMGDMYSQSSPIGGSTGGTGAGMTGGTGGGMTGGTGTGTTGGNYLPAVQTINFASWLDKLRELNNEFYALFTSRGSDRRATSLLQEAKQARQKTDKLLRGCLGGIDMLVMANGEEPYRQLIATINEILHDWSVTLKTRKGRAKAEKEKAENNGSAETPADTSNEGENNTNEGGSDNTGEENGGDNNGENGGENTNTDNGGFGDENTPSANA